MSKLEELINKLCPNGVKYFALKDIEESGTISLGRGKIISKKDIQDYPGDYPVYSSSAIGDGEIGRYGKYMFDDERITWSIDGGGKFFYRNNIKYSVTNEGGWIKVNKKEIITKYLYFALINEWSKKRFNYIKKAHPSVVREEYRIPVPPLEIQEKIVEILDKFTDCVTELTAELTLRKKQYECYRDNLLDYDNNNVKHCLFGEIANISRGASPRPIKSYITKDPNGVNWIKIGDVKEGSKYITETAERITIDGAKKSKLAKEGDFILSNSMSFGRPYIVKKSGCIHDGWLLISNFTNYLLPDFLYHLLSSNKYQKIMKQKASFGGAVQNLNADIVKSLPIPLPSISEQQRIVDILDKFDAYCNDLTQGLPAEIEARQKQYEYYRDKLLTFKPLED